MDQPTTSAPNPYQTPIAPVARRKRSATSRLTTAEIVLILITWTAGMGFWTCLKMSIYGPPTFLVSLGLPPVSRQGIAYYPAGIMLLVCAILCIASGTKLLFSGSQPARWLGSGPMVPIVLFFLYLVAGGIGDRIGF